MLLWELVMSTHCTTCHLPISRGAPQVSSQGCSQLSHPSSNDTAGSQQDELVPPASPKPGGESHACLSACDLRGLGLEFSSDSMSPPAPRPPLGQFLLDSEWDGLLGRRATVRCRGRVTVSAPAVASTTVRSRHPRRCELNSTEGTNLFV